MADTPKVTAGREKFSSGFLGHCEIEYVFASAADALLAALIRHGVHGDVCPANPARFPGTEPCTCGLSAAIAQATEKK